MKGKIDERRSWGRTPTLFFLFGLLIVQVETQSTGFGYQRVQKVGVVVNLKQKRLSKKVQRMAEMPGT
jgi:hypothetical protein